MEQQTKKFPIDFDALNKGDLISAEDIEDAYGVKRTSRSYAFSVLRMKAEIERELSDLGRPVTCKSEGDCVRVLTDEESLEYNARRFESNVHGVYRAHRRTADIDTENLSASSQASHAHTLQLQAMQCLALKKVRRRMSIEPHENAPQLGRVGSDDGAEGVAS